MSDRDFLGFLAATREAFAFLETDYALPVRRAEPTIVRYEGDRRFVNVLHGQLSYELGVEVGRWLYLNGALVEQCFSLPHVVALTTDPRGEGVRPVPAGTPDAVARFVPQIAEWTRRYVTPILDGGDDAFDRMSAHAARDSQLLRADALRLRADTAWHRKDYAVVAREYREILAKLPLADLSPSEQARFEYAVRMTEPLP